METLGISDVADALRLMNGVSVRDYGGLGGMKTISVRHLSATHTAVLYDGVPVSNCQAGQIDVSRFPSSNLSQMRLGIGASAPSLSSESMLMPASVEPASAVLSLLTSNSSSDSDKAPQTPSASITYGSWRSSLMTLSGHNLWLNLRHTDGNYPFTLRNGNVTERLHRNNSRMNSIAAEVNRSMKLSSDGSSVIDGKAYYYHSAQHLPGSIIYYNNVSHEKMTDDNILLQGRYRKALLPHSSEDADLPDIRIQVLSKYNFSHNGYFDGNIVADNDVTPHHFRYTQHEGYLSAGAVIGFHGQTHTSLSLVSDLTLNVLDASNMMSGNPLRLSSHTALRVSSSAGNLFLNGSLLYTSVHDDHASDLGRWLPSVSASYRMFERANTTLFFRISARDAFRVPSFNDLYYSRIGNQTLRPETTHEYNAGVSLNTGLSGLNIQVSVDAFRNYVRNKIVAVPGTFSWRMYNYGSCRIQGIESSADISASFRGLNVKSSVGYSFSDCHLPYVPRHSGNGSLIITSPWGTSIGYFMHWTSTRYSRQEHSWRYCLPSYSDHNISVSQPMGRHFIVQISCNNLADEQYEIIQYYPMPGRSYMLTVKIR